MEKLFKKYKVEWDINEFEKFEELMKDIKKRSETLSQRIKNRIKENINHIKQNPLLFEKDSLKINNDGSYRKFHAIHIRIAYKIEDDKIIIARVRHSSSDPLEY